MIRIDIKRTSFFKELTEEKQKKFFNFSSKKVIPHIDTLYYTVTLDNDIIGNTDSSILDMIDFLNDCKKEVSEKHEDMWLYYENDILYRNRTFKLYNNCIGKEGYYDIFIASNIPNNNTPRIFVQLRSIGLWEIGEYELIKESYNALNILLNEFDVKVKCIYENRIDYCYHTNLIQNPNDFFSDKCLINNLKSNLKIYNKVGEVRPGSITIDYLSLGSRKSKNIFFRTYNKVKEVVNQNYKGFFLEFWYNQSLINYYDFFVYSYAYDKKNYNYIWEGMAKFYIKYGSNIFVKAELENMIKDDNVSFNDLRDYVSIFMPSVTQVINIEFQTMRKFYSYGDEAIDLLPIDTELQEFNLLRLFRILDNRKIFLDHFTDKTVSFVNCNTEENSITLDFWKRIQNVKIVKHYKGKFVRIYPVTKLDEQKIINKLKKQLARYSIVKHKLSSDLNEDMSLLFGALNDNDVKFNNDGIVTVIDTKYNEIKEKEKKALKSLLNKNKTN